MFDDIHLALSSFGSCFLFLLQGIGRSSGRTAVVVGSWRGNGRANSFPFIVFILVVVVIVIAGCWVAIVGITIILIAAAVVIIVVCIATKQPTLDEISYIVHSSISPIIVPPILLPNFPFIVANLMPFLTCLTPFRLYFRSSKRSTDVEDSPQQPRYGHSEPGFDGPYQNDDEQ